MSAADTERTRLAPEIAELGLEEYVLQLEVDGLAVIPPEVHGVSEERIDELAQLLLGRAEEIVGCPFDIDDGPQAEIEFPVPDHVLAELAAEKAHGVPSQFLIQKLCHLHRSVRDLAGAFPKRTPGMRLSISNYYRHLMVLPQEEFRNNFDRSLADDCDDPALFRTLCGFDDLFPYVEQSERVPRAVGS